MSADAQPLAHGAVALLNASALIAARRTLASCNISAERRINAAKTLIERGNSDDRERGQAILAVWGRGARS